VKGRDVNIQMHACGRCRGGFYRLARAGGWEGSKCPDACMRPGALGAQMHVRLPTVLRALSKKITRVPEMTDAERCSLLIPPPRQVRW
jgi:hypothetical protein